MKLQKLTIHNIASIEDAVIDFEAQPLKDSEVFLITGKTGAGKSTILDAICLALYANTPRLASTMMQGDTKDYDEKVSLHDVRQLMRRNTGTAFVSLTFIGSDDVHYEATWSVHRSRDKADGTLQKRTWQLQNLDTGFTMTKEADIKPAIHAAIGLDFNQFCRTTMLAQGEFTRFLNSKDTEKADILEKITGMDIYAKIGAKVFSETSRKEQDWKQALQLVEGTRTLTDAEIEEKQRQLSELDDQYKKVKSESDKDTAKREWLKRENELSKGKIDAADALRQANEAMECEDFRQKEQTIKEWNATIDARIWMTEAGKASDRLKEQNTTLEKLAESYTELLGGQQFAKIQVGQLEHEIKEIDDFISAEADKKSIYENAQAIEALLTAISDGREMVKKSQDTIASENKMLIEDLMPAHEQAETAFSDARKAAENDASIVKAKEEAVTDLNLPDLRNNRENAKDLHNKIATAKDRIDTLEQAKAQHEEKRNSLAERKTSLDKKMAESAAMDRPILDAKIRMDACKELLDKQRDTVDKFASAIRSKLQVGDICPVCRQEIKAVLPQEEELTALVDGLQKAYDDAEKVHRDLNDEKVKIEAGITTESEAYDRDEKAFNEDKTVAAARERVVVACQDCGIVHYDDTTLSQLEELDASTYKTFNDVEAIIKEGEKQEAELRILRTELEEKRKTVEELGKKVTESEKKVNDCKGRISNAETLLISKENEVNSSEQRVSEQIAGSWEINWNESPKEFANALKTAAKNYSDKVQEKQTLESTLAASKTNVVHVQTVLDAITTTLPAWNYAKAKDVVEIENLAAKANALSTSVATTLDQIKTAEESKRINGEKLDDFLSAHTGIDLNRLKELNKNTSADITNASDSLKNVRDLVVARKTLLENVVKQMNEHQEGKPALAEDDTLDSINKRIEDFETQCTRIGEKKGAINQELAADRKNREDKGELIRKAEEKKADYQRWSRINSLIGDSKGDKFRKIAQSYVLTSLIHAANAYMKTLTDRYTLKVTPGTFVILLEDAYQGFVSRPASTISGGESFLVSLSLALALSDIGQTLSVDTLFIDEGFGTLSGEPLQNAINTLRSLHTKAGRHVGIISHVEELRDRIPVQIQVNQEGNNSSSQVKIVPES